MKTFILILAFICAIGTCACVGGCIIDPQHFISYSIGVFGYSLFGTIALSLSSK